MRHTLAKFGLPFEKATPLVHFPKALKRPWNTVVPDSIFIYIYFNQFISSLADLVWESDCGGAVAEAEKPEVASVWRARS